MERTKTLGGAVREGRGTNDNHSVGGPNITFSFAILFFHSVASSAHIHLAFVCSIFKSEHMLEEEKITSLI